MAGTAKPLAIATDGTRLELGGASGITIDPLALPLDTYRYGKAINAAFSAMVPSAVDVLIAFVQANSSPGSNSMRAVSSNIPAPPGGDYETLVLAPWLATLTSPPTLAQLRASALTLTY